MTRSTTHSKKQWRAIKPEIQRWWLDDDMATTEVVKRLREEKQFFCTERQLKSRFANWRWIKKVDMQIYMAMSVLLEKYDSTMVFQVPKKTGREIKEMTPSCVKKEVRRKRNNADQKHQLPEPTLRDAVLLLDANGVFVGRGLTASRIGIALSALLTQPSLDDDGSTINGSLFSEAAHEDGGIRELNDRNFPQQIPQYGLHPDQPRLFNQPRQTDRCPYPDAFVASLTTTVLPQTEENDLVENLRRNLSPDAVRIVPSDHPLTNDDLLNNLPELFAELSCSLDSDDARRQQWERFLGLQLGKHYRRFDPDHSKQMVIEFAAYYVQQCLAGFETLDPVDHPDRQEACEKLAHMLRDNNAHILPTIFWVSTVLGANDKNELLAGFYDDCWDRMEECHSTSGDVFRPIIFSMVLAVQRGNAGGVQTQRVHRLQGLRQEYDPSRAFLQSIDYLSSHGHHESPTMLIVQSYYAWYLQQRQDALDGSLQILLNYLPVAERIMGVRHLITVNYLSLLARAYEKQNKLDLAETNIRFAICRLQGCATPLRAYQHRLTEKLGEVFASQGHITEALWSFEEVFRVRLSTVGACNGQTWGVARRIWKILNLQGRGDEARHREMELHDQYNAEYRFSCR